jgi:plastocyanin domain-containing protein
LKTAIYWGTLAGFSFLLGATTELPGIAMNSMQHLSENSGQFQRIDQPLGHKVAVTLGGLGLIGLEFWWFHFSKPKSRKGS